MLYKEKHEFTIERRMAEGEDIRSFSFDLWVVLSYKFRMYANGTVR